MTWELLIWSFLSSQLWKRKSQCEWLEIKRGSKGKSHDILHLACTWCDVWYMITHGMEWKRIKWNEWMNESKPMNECSFVHPFDWLAFALQ